MSYKWWLVIAGGLFILGIILGLSVTPGVTNLLLEQVAYLQELAATLGPFQVSTAIFIFLKNASTLLLGFIFSPVLCLVPVATLVLNGGMISFILKERSNVEDVLRRFELFALAESLGGAASLVEHPGTMSHASMPLDYRQTVGITDELIRLSIGLENADDLIDDLKQALAKAQ